MRVKEIGSAGTSWEFKGLRSFSTDRATENLVENFERGQFWILVLTLTADVLGSLHIGNVNKTHLNSYIFWIQYVLQHLLFTDSESLDSNAHKKALVFMYRYMLN